MLKYLSVFFLVLDVMTLHAVDRRAEITKYISHHQQGIEIGPYWVPLAPKKNGYNCLVIDVFDTQTLKEMARKDPNIPSGSVDNIETVDIQGSAAKIEELVAREHELGGFDYIISSHNFEHLPNPIQFLQGCSKILKEGGMLSMAIPDLRVCFDYFRPHTSLSSWIEAYFSGRVRPTPAQIFDLKALDSRYGQDSVSFPLTDDPLGVRPLENLKQAFDAWKSALATQGELPYVDTHCSTFTPSSFELLINDLNFLGLISFDIVEVSNTNGNEFYVHLKNRGKIKEYSEEETRKFYDRRKFLLFKIKDEIATNAPSYFSRRRR